MLKVTKYQNPTPKIIKISIFSKIKTSSAATPYYSTSSIRLKFQAGRGAKHSPSYDICLMKIKVYSKNFEFFRNAQNFNFKAKISTLDASESF